MNAVPTLFAGLSIFKAVAKRIEDKRLVVKNDDGTYKCPLSPGRKKQSYKYREILAHATGVANGKNCPEKKGGHKALMVYLLTEMADKSTIPQAPCVLYLEQKVPTREATATKLLAPWMGILVNIDIRIGPGAADIKEKFKAYNPEKLDVFHDYQGHQGTAVVTFRNDIHGLEDARAFEQSFAAIGRGRKEWWHEQRPADMDLYGWQATEEDLEANLGQLTKHLKNLNKVKDMVEENERMNKQIVNDLVKTLDAKNDFLDRLKQFVVNQMRNMVAEMDVLRVRVEEIEEQHKRGLEEMCLQLQAKMQRIMLSLVPPSGTDKQDSAAQETM